MRRVESIQRRLDTRQRVMQKWARIRLLDEWGNLVQKSGLAELANNDLASLYGAMLELVEYARDRDLAVTRSSWQRRGKQALAIKAENASIPRFGQR